MQPPRSLLAALLGLSLLTAAGAAQGKRWIVDDTPGPDVDFNSIQLAVDAAADLDLVVVREGAYGFFEVAGKALTIVGEGAAVVTPIVAVGQSKLVVVRDLPAGKSVVLRGFDVDPFLVTGEVSAPAVRLVNDQGPVVLEDMDLSTDFGAGVSIEDCAAVTIHRCVLTGGSMIDFNAGTWLSHAGLFARDSDVYVYDTVAQGSAGGNGSPGSVFPPLPAVSPGEGKPGVQLQGGTLLATGCTFLGGASGGDGTGACLPAEDGAPGLSIDSFNTVPVVRLLDTTLVGGAGGVTTAPCAEPDGAAGPPLAQSSGTLENLPGGARSFDWDAPVVGGDSFDLHYTGQAGDLAILLITIGPGPDTYLDGFGSALLIDPFYLTAVIDFLPASGSLSQTLIAVEPGLVEYVRLTAQAAFVDTAGQFFLSGPSTLTILTPDDER